MYDIVVIGGGSAGLSIASYGANFGFKVLLIEKDKLGGDCLWNGCVPTKSLVSSSKIIHNINKYTKDLEASWVFNFKDARERMIKAQEKIAINDSIQRFNSLGVDVIIGEVKFLDENKLEVQMKNEKRIINSKKFIIATGSSPKVPNLKGLLDIDYLTNIELLKLKELPKSIIILGSGPIGIEFAQILNRFGVDVKVVLRGSRILKKEEKIISNKLKNILEDEGIEFIEHFKQKEIKQEAKQVLLIGNIDKKEIIIQAEKILIATGRQGNIENLGLENIGVKTNKGYIVVDLNLRTTKKNIYAIGDVIGGMQFTHVASYEARLAFFNSMYKLNQKRYYKDIPYATYCDPEIFHLGLTEIEALKEYKGVKVYELSLEEVDRFVAEDNTNGIIRIICDKNGYILGAHGLLEDASSVLQPIVYAMKNKKKVGSLSQIVYPYPSKSEALKNVTDLYWREFASDGIVFDLIKKYGEIINKK
ncbi:NAD(P)/FAD-dependent oxidoreductase [Peptostreptococcaceae bacterium AGR-M142]